MHIRFLDNGRIEQLEQKEHYNIRNPSISRTSYTTHESQGIQNTENMRTTIQEVDPISNDQVGKILRDTMSTVVESISSVILDRITTKLDLDNSITLKELFKLTRISNGSHEYNLFHSTYQDEIIKKIEKELAKRGYECTISVGKDKKGVADCIDYETRVMRRIKMGTVMKILSTSLLVAYVTPILSATVQTFIERHMATQEQ